MTKRSPRTDDELREQVTLVRDGLTRTAKVTSLLGAIAWPAAIEQEFFKNKAQKLPVITYEVDRDGCNARIAELQKLLGKITGDDDVARWLRATVESFVDGNRLLLAVGTTEFYKLSRELYGGARTRFLGDAARNIDLAEHVMDRIQIRGWDEARDPEVQPLTDEGFAEYLRARLTERTEPNLEVDVAVDSDCRSKVIAGMSRVRVRRGASFLPYEAEGLFVHEVETHALTAQNGAAQDAASFLRAGGPRSTRTQEGLAIFSELYSRTLSIERLERLALRVQLVDKAEQGADFIELYRTLLAHGSTEHDAYLDAQRICRGGRVEGGAPFTKDAAYLAGLLHVYSFLSVVVRGGMRDEAEMIVSGRIALDDVPALVDLRHRGILARPRFLPGWLRDWKRLLPYFAFAAFFNQVNLPPVEEHYRRIFELADAPAPA